jgi:hypothetical protein
LCGIVALLAACHPARGCAESEFTLAPTSRLPRWFVLPPKTRRSDVQVTLVYYPAPLSGPPVATVTLRRNDGAKLDEVVATLRGGPESLASNSTSDATGYPMYEVLTARGTTEVIEHRRMEPMFYVNDAPEVRRRLGITP